MDAQLPLIDGDGTEAPAPSSGWQLDERARRRGLAGVQAARQALVAARRRAVGHETADAGPSAPRRAA